MASEKFRWLALTLVGIITLAYLLQSIFPTIFPTENLALVSSKVLERPWTVFTYMFLHANASHLFFNMFALALFGSILEAIIGYRNFLIVFFSAGIVSGIASVFFYSSVIGASGAIFGILGALGMIRPKMVAWVLSVPMPMIVAVAVWAALDMLGIFYPDQIAHVGHLAGLVFGLVAGLKLRGKYKLVEEKGKKAGLTEKELDEWEDKYIRKHFLDGRVGV
jgi:membrane associated rhomboid family serine protease